MRWVVIEGSRGYNEGTRGASGVGQFYNRRTVNYDVTGQLSYFIDFEPKPVAVAIRRAQDQTSHAALYRHGLLVDGVELRNSRLGRYDGIHADWLTSPIRNIAIEPHDFSFAELDILFSLFSLFSAHLPILTDATRRLNDARVS